MTAWMRAARFGGLLVMLLPAPAGAAPAQTDAAVLAGVWGVQRVVGPEIAGTVTVTRAGSAWRAFAAGFAADGATADGLPAFRFPGGRGELRADVAHATGYWLQPEGATHSAYAAPLRLLPLGPNAWRGTIAPLPDRIEAYLVFVRAADGTVRAFVRDPVGNRGLRTAFARVALDGDRVRLFTANAEYDGTLDAKRETLSIALPSFVGTLDFTRRDAAQAAGLYPRTPMRAHIAAATPLRSDDGWSVAPVAAVGLRSAPLDAMLNQVLATPTDDVRAPYIQSVLVARHGKLVLDEYFYGFAADRPHDIRSAGKTLDDALVGIAAFRGARIGDTTLVAPSYRAYAPFANDDPRKARLTVGNLLTMSSGFACDDNDDDSPGQEDRIQSTQHDWYRATLDLPLAYAPGSRAVYCSQGMNLIGGVLAGATHAWLPAFFHTAFAEPLGFGPYYVPMMPTGTMYLGGGEYVAPRDFLKFGQLFLDGGVWHGHRLMSGAWVQRSLQPHAALQSPDDYGYAWHILHVTAGGKTYVIDEAGGNGGQMLFVIPSLDAVALITAGNYGDYSTWRKFADLIPQAVIAAAS
jgi:CubicO group peptidase (beta-lactamase class C family)